MSDNVSIGSSMHIKGELTGKEDLTIDGRVDGKILLTGHQLTIGENGHVTAEIHDASAVIVRGTMVGNITADDRVEVATQGSMQGDIRAPRVILADGSRFKGTIDTESKSAAAQRTAAHRSAAPPAPPRSAPEIKVG